LKKEKNAFEKFAVLKEKDIQNISTTQTNEEVKDESVED